MRLKLKIAGIGFDIQCNEQMTFRGKLKNYVSDDAEEIQISIISKKHFSMPQSESIGEDMFCEYYMEKNSMQVVCKGAGNNPAAMFFCENDMKKIRCERYEQMQSDVVILDSLFSLLPLRQILWRFDAFIFHSSRIEMEGKAILFTGPSGIGKTTQALLWKKYETADHLSNDRTILRLENGKWKTYGYFEDGSEPIARNQCVDLGAIVVLGQETKERIYKMKGKESIKAIMEQVFLDKWDYKMINHIMNMLFDLITTIPVYYLGCTKERDAIECLKKELCTEGVLKGNEDY